MKVTGILADKGFHAFDGEHQPHTGLKVPHVWIVVADSEQAFIYRKTPKGLEEISHAEAKGKQMKSAGEHMFAPQSLNPDKHDHTHSRDDKPDHADIAFAQRLVEWLDVAEKEKAFDEIILVAPPHTLGSLRGLLPKALAARVTHDLNKDLTKENAQELAKHLKDLL